jgi:penicillin G amidase
MRILPFLTTAVITGGLVFALNKRWGSVPDAGAFLSPQQGIWKNAEPANGAASTDLKFPQLKGKASVYYDERMVPHVFAANEADLYFVQGYIHAKDRLWQMEFQTYAAAGRVSEIVGDKALNFDRGMRRLGMVFAANNSLKEMEKDAAIKAMADAYTAGVNAYIESLSPSTLPLEYKLLGYRPEPWNNLKSALFLKYMSLDLAGHEDDFEYTNAKSLFTKDAFELIYPQLQDSLDPIVPKGTVFDKPGIALKIPANADSVYFNYKNNTDTIAIKGDKPDKDNGSNNWAVGGSKTQSGKPILCNDPHLNLNLPSLWYEMQLHTPQFNAYGATFPGAPSVIIGFNDSIAFGFTNAMRDVRDYYEIKFKDSSRGQYWFNGAWKTTQWWIEKIGVRGQPDYTDSVAYIPEFGPVMYDNSFTDKLNDAKLYAVRWKAHDASNEMRLFYGLNHAKNYNDYLAAIQSFECPGQNMLFASKSGDIAIWQQGEFPAKWRRQGDFVMPGTDSSYMWQGMIPQSENPHQVNPARGFVSSANQLPVDGTYPYYLGGSYPPYRGLYINRRLTAMSNISPNDMQTLQTDNYNIFAELARPMLLKYTDEASLSADEKKYLDMVKSWNLRNDPGEQGATVFRRWFEALEDTIWHDEYGQTRLPLMWPHESTLMEALLRDSTYRFVDNIKTAEREMPRQMITAALKAAAVELKKTEAEGKLAWSKYKDSGVPHLLKVAALGKLHLTTGGGEHIINATKQYHGPSWRMVVHLTTPTEAYGIYPGGQSGNPGSPYYDNFAEDWAAGKYYRLWMMNESEKEDKRVKLTLHFSN